MLSYVLGVCDDDLSTCEALVSSVPSSCYSADLRQRCCRSCESYLGRRTSLGFNTIQCPYGDRSSTCIAADFDSMLAFCSFHHITIMHQYCWYTFRLAGLLDFDCGIIQRRMIRCLVVSCIIFHHFAFYHLTQPILPLKPQMLPVCYRIGP